MTREEAWEKALAHEGLLNRTITDIIRTTRTRHSRDDLKAYGWIGLLRAVEANKKDAPQSFSTLATKCIRAAVVDGMREMQVGAQTRKRGSVEGVRYVDGSIDDPNHCEDAAPDRFEDRVDIRMAVEALPEPERSAVRLHFFEDMNQEAIAALLDIPQQRISDLLSRAKARLRVALTPSNS